MESYLTVEVGRTTIDGNEITAIFGKFKRPEEDLSVHKIIELDTQKSPQNHILAEVFVNDKFVAKSGIFVIENNFAVRIDEIVNDENNILNWAERTVIELNKEANRPSDVLENEIVIAKGNVFSKDGNFAIRITETASQKSENTDDLLNLIISMEKRPALFIEDNDITALKHFLSGYCYAKEISLDDNWIFNDFSDFLAKKYQHTHTYGWCEVIIAHEPDGNSMDAFFRLFREYQETVNT